MRRFKVDPLAQSELDDAVGWYEREREGLGLEFIEEVDRVLARIETLEEFATSPLAMLDHGVVRRAFVRRFPYVVVFVETDTARRVIMIRRGNVSPARSRSRI